jgi:soluble lytic murein transglycosylase-like protein
LDNTNFYFIAAIMFGIFANSKAKGAALKKGTWQPWTPPEKSLQFQPHFSNAEFQYNLPENILVRMAQQESNFRFDIIRGDTISKAGAVGLMQIIPRWHPEVDPLEPVDSIYYAGKYLRDLYNKFGSWRLALAAYNWGPSNVEKYLQGRANMPKETKNYVSEIMRDIKI